MLKVIRSLAQQHTTMIIVTHEMAFARDVADQVIFMDGGVIVEQGPAREVIDNPSRSAPATSWPGTRSNDFPEKDCKTAVLQSFFCGQRTMKMRLRAAGECAILGPSK